MKTASSTIADMLDQSRQLSRFYLSKMKELNPFENYVLGDVKLNSIYWITAHLVLAENRLVLHGTGGKDFDLPKLKNYWLGSNGEIDPNPIPFKDLLHLMAEVHESCLAHIRSMSDEDLMKNNHLNFSFGNEPNNINLLYHVIRHEAAHAGHLGWIAKLNKIKTL